MQFKVPQFLDIEDKIFGPFTFREFAYLAGGAGLCFTLYKLLGLFWGILPMLLIAGLSLALTFYRPNNKPFINMIASGFRYLTQDKLYIWKKHGMKSGLEERPASKESKLKIIPQESLRLTSSKLRDLAWSLDILDLTKQKEPEK